MAFRKAEKKMKNHKLTLIAFVVMALSFFVSCDNEETSKTADEESLVQIEQIKKDLAPVLIQKRKPANMTLEQVVRDLDELATQEDRVVKATILFNPVTEGYGYEKVFVYKNKDMSDFMKGALRAMGGRYQLDCAFAEGSEYEGKDYTKFCDDLECIGWETMMCLAYGGCATTCAASDITIAPKVKENSKIKE